jgi:hypothetical protein
MSLLKGTSFRLMIDICDQEDDKEDVSNYWMTLRKREEIEIGSTRSQCMEN